MSEDINKFTQRKMIIDIETTGIKFAEGHRIVEVAAIEIENLIETGRELHFLCNPERDIPDEVVAIHGITNEKVKNLPPFKEMAIRFLEFIGDSPLVIHNAEFDMGFINNEMSLCQLPPIDMSRAECSLILARQKFPGAKNSLDALCERFNISLSGRSLHGALIDCRLLAQVYLELCGGRQQGLSLMNDAQKPSEKIHITKTPRASRQFLPTKEELHAHQLAMKKIPESLWLLDKKPVAEN